VAHKIAYARVSTADSGDGVQQGRRNGVTARVRYDRASGNRNGLKIYSGGVDTGTSAAPRVRVVTLLGYPRLRASGRWQC